MVKRIIGISGDVIDYEHATGSLFINGVKQIEDYIKEPMNRWDEMQLPLTVPEGHLFLMGDNRNISLDSRNNDVGFVDERTLLGRVLFRITPLNKFGRVE